MVTYTISEKSLECEDCGYKFDGMVRQEREYKTHSRFKVLGEEIERCPKCGGECHTIVENPFFVKVEGEPSTLGQMAEKNTKAMGRYELEERRRKEKEDYEKRRDAAIEEVSKKTGHKIEKPREESPTFGKNLELRSKLGKATPEKQLKYIKTGEI